MVGTDSSIPHVSLERDGGYAVITLQGLGKDNTLTEGLVRELEDVLRTLQEDRRVITVILTGPPQRAFCCGFEVGRPSSEIPAIHEGLRLHPFDRLRSRVTTYEGVTIAALNGDAFGMGLELALACDLRLAVTGVRVGFPGVVPAMLPSPGSIRRLVDLVGDARARELLLTAESIAVDTAQCWGLVSEVVPPPELLPRAKALAQELSRNAPWALRTIKEAVRRGADLSLHDAISLEVDLYMLLHTTEDRLEGIRAFQERRTPQFTGT